MNGFAIFLDLLANGGGWSYFFSGVFILGLLSLVVRFVRKKVTSASVKDLPIIPQKQNEDALANDEAGGVNNTILGNGIFKCMCIRPGNILDFTTVPNPIGEAYQFDPSCPVSGYGYIVKELSDESIVDYDPRNIEVVTDETPEAAWDAVHWKDDVVGFWTVAVAWWKSPASWFAGGMIAVTFILGLVIFD